MTLRTQAWIVAGALGALAVLLWLLAGVLLPFVLGAGFAYLLDPVVRRVERARIGRPASVAFVVLTALAAVAAILVVLLPPAIEQVVEAVRGLPDAVDRLRRALATALPGATAEQEIVDGLIETLRQRAESASGQALLGALSGGRALLDILGLAIVTPVVTVYLLLDWRRVVEGAGGLIPPRHRPTVRELAGQVDRVVAGFLRGQLTVCAILGAFYAGALSLIGLEFGLVIGLASGLLAFIPVVGTAIGGILSVGVAIAQFYPGLVWVAAVAAIYLAGQLVEGNFLTPRLVGREVRLHPVWLIFALSAFGALFGVLGVIIAVPAAAAIGVLTRHALARYRESALFRGERG